MTFESYLAFCVAAAALALVPGPTVTVIIANSLRYGAKAGLMNVLGTQAGFVIWLALATAGLNAALQVMGVWFDVLRWAGAAYLVWLGIKLFMSKGDLALAVDRARVRHRRHARPESMPASGRQPAIPSRAALLLRRNRSTED